MNAMKFLFAAYIATWLIHGVYLGSLVRRFSRMRQQWKELKASGFRRSAPGFPPQVYSLADRRRDLRSSLLPPLRGFHYFLLPPTAFAVGCILSLLRG